MNLLVIFVCCVTDNVSAQKFTNSEIGIEQKLQHPLLSDLIFQNSSGEDFKLDQVLQKPLIIAPVYYRCPNLCSATLTGLVKVMNEMDLKLGSDYNAVAVSFNPAEATEIAEKKRQNYIKTMKDQSGAEKGLFFLTGKTEPIEKLMKNLGFNYRKDGEEYAHSAGIMIINTNKTISHYFLGANYSPKDLRYALIEASNGKVGTFSDAVALYCLRFDPAKGQYTFAIWRVTQIVCSGFAIIIFTWIFLMRRSEKKLNYKN